MNDLMLKRKIILTICVIILFLACHFSANFISNYRNIQRTTHIFIDDFIPFIPKFFYFYLFTYLFNTIFLFLIIYKEPMDKFVIIAKMMIALIIIGTGIYIIYPAKIQKPQIEVPNGLAEQLLLLHNSYILPYNAFPSLHIAFSLLTTIISFMLKSIFKYLYLIIFLLIFFSALFTKQHYIIDNISGLLLAFIIFKICNREIKKI